MNGSIVLTTLFTLLFLFSCKNDGEFSDVPVIPQPNEVVFGEDGVFKVTAETEIVVSEHNDSELMLVAKHLSYYLKASLQIDVKISSSSAVEGVNSSIYLSKNNSAGNDGEYNLLIDKNNIEIASGSYSGLFYGVQTLKQLLFTSGELNSITINDKPQYGYRGLMLDVSRHFFSIEEIKRTLDLMALYKFNTFHWHLTDDQGWRIEIKKYPLLTDIGSYRTETILEKNFEPFIGDGIPHSGFYSQEDIREIVQYAKERYITVIPEIDMPGHMQAALAAYPELACTSGPFEVSTRWGVHKDILCPSETTFEFIETVLEEVMALFPSQYIHIGGDEVPTTRWKTSDLAQQLMLDNNLPTEHELQGYFYERVANFLHENGRKAIGWDEIIEKGINDKTTVMVWRGLEHAKSAVQSGHQVILTPTNFTYLNYYQGNQSTEPLAQCCMVTLDTVYNFSLELDNLTENEQSFIKGAQASLWTEYIKTQQHLEYMMLPRMLALSEVMWTKEEFREWEEFTDKLPFHYEYFDSESINYKLSIFDD